jgi:hypothetical protein
MSSSLEQMKVQHSSGKKIEPTSQIPPLENIRTLTQEINKIESEATGMIAAIKSLNASSGRSYFWLIFIIVSVGFQLLNREG